MNDGHQGHGLDASAPEAAAAPGPSGPPGCWRGGRSGTAGPDQILEDEPWDAERAQSLLSGAGLATSPASSWPPRRRSWSSWIPSAPTSSCPITICRAFPVRTALAIAQERYPDVPFIIWSGVLGDEAAVALIKQGATDYVLKDRPARLPSVIGRALAEAEQRHAAG